MCVIDHRFSVRNTSQRRKNVITITYIVTITIDVITKEM